MMTSTRPRTVVRPWLLVFGMMLALVAPLTVSVLPARAEPLTTGTVFRDFDGDGVRDPGNASAGVQTDLAISGIGVRAYDELNNLVGTTTTGANGTYTLDTPSVAAGDPLRIEFDDAQQPDNPLPGDYQSSFNGANNGTSVQFADAGDTGVDFMVLEPEDYADNNAPILTAIQYAGARDNAAAQLPTVVANPWVVPTNDPASGNYPQRVSLATYSQTGSVWGTTFDRAQNAAYVAASYKRISDLGPLGLGGIYRIANVLNQGTGALNPTGTASASSWLDVATLTVAGSPINLGTVASNTTRGIGDPAAPTRDDDAYRQAGKVGIGGIAVSEDGNTLFFVNLFDKSVYAVDITGGAVPTTATQIATPAGANQRPWALAVHRDQLYVGYADTGEAQGPGVPASTADLNFYVGSKSVASAEDGTPGWATVLTSPLGYAKGNNITGWPTTTPQNRPQIVRWNTWTDTWTWTQNGGGSVGMPGYSPTHMYPQAIVGSLAFDAAGRMVIGLIDRASIQGGNRQWGTDTTDNQFYETVSSGDMLNAAPGGGTTFTLESNGSVGGTPGVGTGNNQGPGGGEFFEDSQGASDQGPNHFENTEGGVVTYPGFPEAASTAMDPLNAIRVTGLQWFALSNGEKLRGYNHTVDPLGGVGREGQAPEGQAGGAYFQKGGGIGAVALLTREPPVEIGNRVWLDADFNGRQDADEPNIQGAPVQLFAAGAGGNPTGAALATTATDADGEYYFRTDNATIPDFDPNGEYVVVFGRGNGAVTFTGPNATNPGFVDITWADLDFTDQEDLGPDEIQRDSNPDPDNGRAPVTVGPPGHNDHTIDAGFNTTGTFAITKLIDETGGDPPPGQTYTFDVTAATNFRGTNVLGSIDPSVISVEAGETGPEPADRQELPVGTTVTIAERDLDGQFEAVTYTPSATQTITVNDNEPTVFTVTDRFYLPGEFTVEKLLDGDPDAVAASADVAFNVDWETEDGDLSGTISVQGGEVSEPVELPRNTVVNLTEAEPTNLPPGVDWEGYEWVESEGVTVSEDGQTATITIVTDETIALQLTNTLQYLPGQFTVEKLLDGDAAEDAADVEFTVNWTSDDPDNPSGTITLTGGQTSAPIELPAGTEVNLAEVEPTDLPPGVDWEGYAWIPGEGITISADGQTATITIAADQTVALQLTNTLQYLPGQFTVEKLLAGDAAEAAEDVEFTVNWTSDDPDNPSGTITLTGGQTSAPIELPAGTVVNLTEAEPTNLPSTVNWTGYTWAPTEGVTISEDGQTATFTVGPDSNLGLQITNTVELKPGFFTVEKLLNGDQAAVDAAADVDFTVDWTSDDPDNPSGTITVTSGQTSAPVELPAGTEVTLTEATPTNLPTGVEWESYTWQPTDGVTISDDGQTATFTVASTTTVALQLTNTLSQSPGQFTVEKLLDGDQEAIDAAADVDFTVNWETQDGSQDGTITVKGGETSEPVELPAGTVVNLIEATQADLPDDVEWDGGTWQPADGVSVSDDGSTATITVGAAGTVALQLTNTVTTPPTTPPDEPDEPDEEKLPSTGSPVSLGFIVGGVALVVAGGLALLAARRRQQG